MTDRPPQETPPTRSQLFLHKDSYRQRRLEDALRLWPILGFALFVFPVFWTGGDLGTAGVMIYLFVVWLCLIVGSALMARRLKADPAEGKESEGEENL